MVSLIKLYGIMPPKRWVSLSIIWPKQRLLCMCTRKGCKRAHAHHLEEQKISFRYMGAFLILFLHVGAFSLRFSSYGGDFFIVWKPFATFSLCGGFLLRFSPCGGHFYYMFLHVGAFLSLLGGGFFGLATPPPPTKISEDACYYVTYISCPPPSLTAAFVYRTKPTATPVFNSQ